MRKAFTLIEMVVALGILAVILSFAGVIFRVSIDSHRLSLANAEIMQKLRVITEQLDTDFRGLRKDGEILVFWRAARKPNYGGSNPNHPSAFERFDRIMFFASGDFQTYRMYRDDPADVPKVRRGNLARTCYTLANSPSVDPANPTRPQVQKPEKRILARTQHILLPPSSAGDPNDPLGMSTFTDDQWRDWNSHAEFDRISMRGWGLIPLDRKVDMISVIADTRIDWEIRDDSDTVVATYSSNKNDTAGGVTVGRGRPDSLHGLLCEGVGQFKVQGWSDTQKRWIPEVNPNGDTELTDDSDFILDGADLHGEDIPRLWYPRAIVLGRGGYSGPFDEEHFNQILGLGRALKFTFTLYDSQGLIKNGRTFTHIVYLDD